MAQLDPVTFRQLPVIQKIIDDEVWLEGERRGAPVAPNDPAVLARVCTIILEVGARLRAQCESELAAHPGPAMLPPRHEAA